MMSDILIGYDPGEVEPKIAPLVEAVRSAGFTTFSSCEGHVEYDDQQFPRYTSVSFYASEEEARMVHGCFLHYRDRLACSWILTANFVLHRETNKWTLGWNLENCGVIANGDSDTFVARTVRAGWVDILVLIEMFATLSDPGPSQ